MAEEKRKLTDEEWNAMMAEKDRYEPEFRLELVDGKFMVGGDVAGTRWLVMEILNGWSLQVAMPFAPLEQWEAAMRSVFGAPERTEDWPAWAAGLPDIEIPRPQLGSESKGRHHWVRQNLTMAARAWVDGSGAGHCCGRDIVMKLGEDAFTPDCFVMIGDTNERMHNNFLDGPADVVIEIVLPERAHVDRGVRMERYAKAGIPTYGILDPAAQTAEFFRLEGGAYRAQAPDPDGRYWCAPGILFVPERVWDDKYPYPEVFVVSELDPPREKKRWRYPDDDWIEWDQWSFQTPIGFQPEPISFFEFINRCPEAKMEGYGGHYPVICGDEGTCNSLGMALKTLGLEGTLKLWQPREWMTVLQEAAQYYAGDEERRREWWDAAHAAARMLNERFGFGGIGVIGDLIRPKPLHFWSYVHLVLWGEGKRDDWKIYQELREIVPEKKIRVEWDEIEELTSRESPQLPQMAVLMGERPEEPQQTTG